MERIPVPVSFINKKHTTFNPVSGQVGNLLDQAFTAVVNGRDFLTRHQQKDGHWVAELQGDTILESEFVRLIFNPNLIQMVVGVIFQAGLLILVYQPRLILL